MILLTYNKIGVTNMRSEMVWLLYSTIDTFKSITALLKIHPPDKNVNVVYVIYLIASVNMCLASLDQQLQYFAVTSPGCFMKGSVPILWNKE